MTVSKQTQMPQAPRCSWAAFKGKKKRGGGKEKENKNVLK